MNGTMEPRRSDTHNHSASKGPKNYKLLVDPFLVKGASKLYRYDGVVPNDASYRPPVPRDPRSHLTRIWTRLETLDLPVPRSVFFLLNNDAPNFSLLFHLFNNQGNFIV